MATDGAAATGKVKRGGEGFGKDAPSEKSKSRFFHLTWKSHWKSRDDRGPHSLDCCSVLSARGLAGSDPNWPNWLPLSPPLTLLAKPQVENHQDGDPEQETSVFHGATARPATAR